MAASCETNLVYLYDRGGLSRIGQFTEVVTVAWERLRDDISTALITVARPSEECCRLLGQVEPGRHEIVIFRGRERVWEGPVTRVADSSAGTVTIEAKDVMQWAYWTIIRRGYNDAYPNCRSAITRAGQLLTRWLDRKERLDPPINVLQHVIEYHIEDEARECRELLDYQKTLWEEIDSFAQYSGIDYVTIGRSILLFDTHDGQIGRTPVITENDFSSEVVITAYGMELATFVGATDGEGHYGWAGGRDPYYGWIERLYTLREEGESATETPSRESLIGSATSHLRGRNPVPTTVRVPANSEINPQGNFSIRNLVPGVRVPLRATLTCRTLTQEQKLDRVLVTESADSGERINVTMSPAPGQTVVDDTGSDQTDEDEEE